MDSSISRIRFGHRAYSGEWVLKKELHLLVAIQQAIREEIELVFFHEIAHKVEKYKIPHSLTLYLDQTLFKFVPGSSRTQSQIGSDGVLIADSNGKRKIIATFTITTNGVF